MTNHSVFSKRDIKDSASKALRQEAERTIKKSDKLLANLTTTQIKELVHELKVHQVELEMQNENLQATKEELEKSRDQYTNLYDNAPVGYLSSNSFGKILKANQTMAHMLQTNVDNLIDTSLNHWCINEDSFYLHCRSLLKQGSSLKEEIQLKRNDNSSFYVLADSIIAEEDSEGNHEIRSIIIDISEKKELEKQLRHAQKMEAVGRLAGGVAHDFNNMLSVILGNIEMALEETNQDNPLYETLDEVQNAARRSANVTQQLLAFASKQTIAPQMLDLNKTITSMMKMLYRLIGEDIELNWMPENALWPVRMDPSQIDQILVNLAVNSKDAMEGGGKITIKTENLRHDDSYCSGNPCFGNIDFIKIQVSDNGHGMDDQTLKNIFEPFFTTKDMDKGTGLGLATVYGIVKQNKGFITVDSQVNEGTSINIYIPRYKTFEKELKKNQIYETISKGIETILLVEDDPMVLEMTSRALKRMEYTVLSSATPEKAIDIVRQHGSNIDLLMSDVIMPEMNGRELAESIQTFYPQIERLFMSGYPADIIADHGVLEEGVNFIQKPFSIKDLSVKLKEIFKGKSNFLENAL